MPGGKKRVAFTPQDELDDVKMWREAQKSGTKLRLVHYTRSLHAAAESTACCAVCETLVFFHFLIQ